MNIMSKIGAVSFVLWGLLHIVGGLSILTAALGNPAQGYEFYQNSQGQYTELAGQILAYFAFLLIGIGITVSYIGGRFNWRNSQSGLAINTLIVGFTDVGLIMFLLLPGYVTWRGASIGLILFVIAVICGGIGCNQSSEHEMLEKPAK